ncbi:MAG: hypothetical protein R8F63_11340 [Acidimicrobiales bacterium]|nr:hypothetical protein [Acidimicrobiales bacterium]
MSKRAATNSHAVIDGSNLATEGRKEPSLAQLKEAVAAIRDEYDFTHVTVIVDATFEHRVAKSETKAARKAIDDNEILTPPAGVIGRGDTFILEVADRADAVVFSNDSFQEFHGTFDWLFDEGRLVGGKPVPGVGWIYVPRSPVRGPVSRRATSERRRKKADDAPKPAAKSAKKSTRKEAEKSSRSTSRSSKSSQPAPSSRRGKSSAPADSADGANAPDAWKTFTNDYPIGTTVAVTVDRFSSHGAYGSVDDVAIYLPNRLLGDPAPTKARDVLDIGSTVDVIVHRFDDERFGIDAGLIPVPGGRAKGSSKRPARKATKQATKKTTKKKAATKRTTKKTTKATTKKVAKKTTKKAATKRSAKKTTKATAAKKTARPAKKAGTSRTRR